MTTCKTQQEYIVRTAIKKVHSYRRAFFPKIPKFLEIIEDMYQVSIYGGKNIKFVNIPIIEDMYQYTEAKISSSLTFQYLFGKKKGKYGRWKNCAKKNVKKLEKNLSDENIKFVNIPIFIWKKKTQENSSVFQIFEIFFAQFFNLPYFPVFFPNIGMLTNLTFLVLENFTNSDRTPPYIDTYLQLFPNFGNYGKNPLQ